MTSLVTFRLFRIFYIYQILLDLLAQTARNRTINLAANFNCVVTHENIRHITVSILMFSFYDAQIFFCHSAVLTVFNFHLQYLYFKDRKLLSKTFFSYRHILDVFIFYHVIYYYVYTVYNPSKLKEFIFHTGHTPRFILFDILFNLINILEVLKKHLFCNRERDD